MLISLQVRKKVKGEQTALWEQNKMKVQVSFSLILFHPLHASFSSSLSLPVTESWCIPLEGTEWNGLWPDACFLRKYGSSVCGLQQCYYSKEEHCPFVCPVCGEWSTKSVGCCGDEMQEHKKPFLSTSPEHRHTCSTKTNCQQTLTKRALVQNQI